MEIAHTIHGGPLRPRFTKPGERALFHRLTKAQLFVIAYHYAARACGEYDDALSDGRALAELETEVQAHIESGTF